MKNRKAIIVLGCHRSGTSVLTKIISIAGADLPKNLLPPSKTNPTGYWESPDIITLNNEILRYFNMGVFDVRLLKLKKDDKQFLYSKIPDMIKVLEDNFVKSPIFVLKDPRMVTLFKFWLPAFKHLKIKPMFVHITRNPLEVAHSLYQRNGIAIEKGLQFWLKETLAAEKQSRRKPRSFVSYEDLLNDPVAVISKIGIDLKINWKNFDERAKQDIQDFVRDDLHHHRINNLDFDKDASSYTLVYQGFIEGMMIK